MQKSMMSPPSAQPVVECPHGLRPGTTVCLRCRSDARAVARQKRVRFATRAGLAFMGVAVVVALIVGAWNAITADRLGSGEEQANPGATDSIPTAIAAGTDRPTTALALEPTIAEGRRQLGDSVYAIREGGLVTVHFDTESLRTRLDWKFEGVVRATLPLVFGPNARAALDSIPSGMLARGGLTTELPTRGITLRLGNQTLKVWPVTRQGRDGPLVVGYRASAAR